MDQRVHSILSTTYNFSITESVSKHSTFLAQGMLVLAIADELFSIVYFTMEKK